MSKASSVTSKPAAKTVIDRRIIPPTANEAIWETRDGHRLRRIDWPGGAERVRGSILFLPGRGDNYEKYLESLEEWHRAGWRVTAADWRGQAGSGRLGKDAVTGHIEDFGIWIEDLGEFWESWKAETPGPHVLAAHSMGGHLVMRALVDKRVDPQAVFLSAPMLGMNGPPLPLPMLHGVATMMTKVGDPTRQAWKWSEKPGELPTGRATLLTHDPDRYDDEQWWRDHRPELVMGPASWRWVERAYASWRELEKPGALESVATPVLIVSTSADKLVSHPANVRAAKRLLGGELVEFGDEAAHEILREVDEVRGAAMQAIAEFLDKHAPASPA
ncbi:alpha/beta fold hydrolase [Erythrobacter rubeus]|uniref:Alpha/beta hydrolase n=1 Tax=Erythrobacter rubeus TaxID=2760803 RepID=A0ABR8KSI9_9SPHN|nr:alpha/beta fold hydrolase [Erythrobacter rubeus]MBD2842550.1 alpha/beta hydrolase [Erythrobacter rubeus]